MYQNILLLTVQAIIHIAAYKFGYDKENGPSTWHGVCRTGNRQSPIDIKAFDLEIAPLDALHFVNYEFTGHIHLENNGHTVIGSGFEKWGKNRPYITNGGLNGTYYLLQFHFHWSQQNDMGSEHTIASLHYSGELHLVHVKKNLSEGEVNSIAVVGVFIRLHDEQTGSLHFLEPYIKNIRMPKTELVVPGFSLHSFLPKHLENFYRYEGSLTTPGCDETVAWTVMADPITVTSSQMQALREVHFTSGKIGHNWRPVQPLNNRKILFRPTLIYNSATFVDTGASMKNGIMLKSISKILMSIWLYGIYHILSI